MIHLKWIKAPLSNNVLVGHIWKFDLEEYKQRNFGLNVIFQKFELSLSCSTFSRKLKISEIQDQIHRITKQREIAIRNYQT